MALVAVFEDIIRKFPREQLRLAFAYGSGVFQQQGHKDVSKNMLDFIFAVDDPVSWHRNNLVENSGHYSFLKHLGPKRLTTIQDRYGARAYFNTLVQCEGRLIKYGVISTNSLINDLLDWETLYISGRLHKPVRIVHGMESMGQEIHLAMDTNLNSALHAALLLLDETFTEEDLYVTIAGLSYYGDFRMTVGEDKNKVRNIVKPNVESFRQIYKPILEGGEDHVHWNQSHGSLEQSLHPASQYHHLNLLPKMIQIGLVNHRNSDGRNRDTEEVLRSFAHDSECREVIQRCVSGIVKQSSLSQSVKGIFTAGIVKSLKYSGSKLRKMIKSMNK